MKSVKYSVEYGKKAGRLELLMRILWSIPSYIVMMVLSIICMIALTLQLLYVIVFGKRHRTLHDWIIKYFAYSVKWGSYIALLTDERNPIMPED